MKKNFFCQCFLLFCFTLLLIGCTGLKYMKTSDDEDAKIIAETQTLVAKSSQSYKTKEDDINALKTHIDNVLAMESKRRMNQATIAMWKSVREDKSNLYDFFELWKQSDKLSPAMVQESNKQLVRVLQVIRTWEQRKKGGPLQQN